MGTPSTVLKVPRSKRMESGWSRKRWRLREEGWVVHPKVPRSTRKDGWLMRGLVGQLRWEAHVKGRPNKVLRSKRSIGGCGKGWRKRKRIAERG
jgi:hypothetical protein